MPIDAFVGMWRNGMTSKEDCGCRLISCVDNKFIGEGMFLHEYKTKIVYCKLHSNAKYFKDFIYQLSLNIIEICNDSKAVQEGAEELLKDLE